jgi:hypothetical protein
MGGYAPEERRVAGLSPPSARSCRSFDPSLPKLTDFAAATNINLAWLVTGRGPSTLADLLRPVLPLFFRY